MKGSDVWLVALLLGALSLLSPAALVSQVGFVVGVPLPDSDLGRCQMADPVFTTPSSGAGLFALREYGTDINDILYSIEGGKKTLGCRYAVYDPEQGVYDCPRFVFVLGQPTENAETVWVIATVYPEGAPGTSHQGWIHLDNAGGLQEDFAPGLVANVVQRLRLPEARVADVSTPTGRVRSVEFTFEHVTEFGTRTGDLPCDVGGLQSPRAFQNRVILGFNVYRLPLPQGPPPDVSTPAHYLCGPDLDCLTTADNGFVAFIPLGDGTDEMSVDPPYTDPKPDDAFRVEDRGNPNLNIVFLDAPGLSPDPPDDFGATHFAYVYQPVIKGVPDSTWNGIPSHDLDGDTLPEFLDPSGHGLGLTANGVSPTEPVILVSGEVVVEAPGIPPAPVPQAARLPRLTVPGSDPAGTPPFQGP